VHEAILFDDGNDEVGDYALNTPIGPISGNPVWNTDIIFATDAGPFSFRAVFAPVTFKATLDKKRTGQLISPNYQQR
jgi:hypothetical protein